MYSNEVIWGCNAVVEALTLDTYEISESWTDFDQGKNSFWLELSHLQDFHHGVALKASFSPFGTAFLHHPVYQDRQGQTIQTDHSCFISISVYVTYKMI